MLRVLGSWPIAQPVMWQSMFSNLSVMENGRSPAIHAKEYAWAQHLRPVVDGGGVPSSSRSLSYSLDPGSGMWIACSGDVVPLAVLLIISEHSLDITQSGLDAPYFPMKSYEATVQTIHAIESRSLSDGIFLVETAVCKGRQVGPICPRGPSPLIGVVTIVGVGSGSLGIRRTYPYPLDLSAPTASPFHS